MEEKLQEILTLQQENNALLKELVTMMKKLQSPEYLAEENTIDFFMNVVANIVASNIENKK